MINFEERGNKIRKQSKELALEFMKSKPNCKPGAEGMKQAEIFRSCRFDWGDYPKTTSSHQQYWIVVILQELKSEGKIERISEGGPWRLL